MLTDCTRSLSVVFGSIYQAICQTYKKINLISSISNTGYSTNQISLSHTLLIPLANALVSRRLDYCNSLLISINEENPHKKNSSKLSGQGPQQRSQIPAYYPTLPSLRKEESISKSVLQLTKYYILNNRPISAACSPITHTNRYFSRSVDNAVTLDAPEQYLGSQDFSVVGPRFGIRNPIQFIPSIR